MVPLALGGRTLLQLSVSGVSRMIYCVLMHSNSLHHTHTHTHTQQLPIPDFPQSLT